MKKNKKTKRKSTSHLREHACIFCGSHTDIQLHHIIQKKFGGPDSQDNLVPVCPHCHRVYHFLTDQMLDYLIVNRKIDNHKIQPKPPIKAPNQIVPELPKADLPPITITGGEVTINFR